MYEGRFRTLHNPAQRQRTPVLNPKQSVTYSQENFKKRNPHIRSLLTPSKRDVVK
jgi:hypothetical protein